MSLEKLNVQPATFFEVKGLFLVIVFPSIFFGFTAVLCGEEKNTGKILTVHDCNLCKAYGPDNCPYIEEGIKYYSTYVKREDFSYRLLPKKVLFNPKWSQFSKEEAVELIKKVKNNEEPITQYSRSS